MAKCPVCETDSTTHYCRGLLVGLLISGFLMLGAFIAGQIFQGQIFDMGKIEKVNKLNEELKSGYVPQRK